MKQTYYKYAEIAAMATTTLYLPVLAQPIVNGDNGEPREIELSDVRNLRVTLNKNGVTGIGRSLPFELRYNYLILNVPELKSGIGYVIDITGTYGQICLHATVELKAKDGKPGHVILEPYVFEVVGDCAFTPIKPKPLRFTNNGATAVGLGLNIYNDDNDGWHPNLQVSYNGIDWRDVNNEEFQTAGSQEYPFTLSPDMSIYFRGMNQDGFNIDCDDYGRNKFMSFEWSHDETQVSVDGDIMSLINYDELTEMPNNDNKNFVYLFGSYDGGYSSLTDASGLITPLTLANDCYGNMFSGCTSLTQAPSLPALTMANDCYSYMFSGCTSLTQAPSLPALTLANDCYNSMFSGCTSLTQAPSLPALTMANYCYSYMFSGCTSLTQAPSLPALTLANSCYFNMFSGCTSLTQAPSLPALTMAVSCYNNMFRECRNISHIEAMFLTTPSSTYTKDWVYGVANDGVFVKNAAATWENRSVNGVPANWEIQLKTA